MIVVNKRMVPIDHVLELDLSALESHRTVVLVTTTGHLQVHDADALKLAEIFGAQLAPPPAPEKKGKR
jgi:hypothetical protein